MTREHAPQQSIQCALDTFTGEPMRAEELFRLSEEEFASLRRQAMAARNAQRLAHRRGQAPGPETAPRFTCLACKHPVWISRQHRPDGNRWFTHDAQGDRPPCPWVDYGRLNPDQTKALIYRGQQEGQAHRELKRALVRYLSRTEGVTDIDEEKVTFSAVAKGEWRRPDVQCRFRGRHLVFEVQVSYLFLSDVIGRDTFYREQGAHVLWLFATFNLDRAAQSDEAFFNRRNLFVLDAEALDECARRNELVFSGYHQQVQEGADLNSIEALEWVRRPVVLGDLKFCPTSLRPYFFDVAAAIQAAHENLASKQAAQIADARAASSQTNWGEVRKARAVLWDDSKLSSSALLRPPGAESDWDQLVTAYLEAALLYCEAGYQRQDEEFLLSLVTRMQLHYRWQSSLAVLTYHSFYGEHGVLPALFSFKLKRVVGYGELSMDQLVNTLTNLDGRRSRVVLYFWALHRYKPPLSQKAEARIRDRTAELRRLVEVEEETRFVRDPVIEPGVRLLFPELIPYLDRPFARDATPRLPGF